jgi:hypothetical protein
LPRIDEGPWRRPAGRPPQGCPDEVCVNAYALPPLGSGKAFATAAAPTTGEAAIRRGPPTSRSAVMARTLWAPLAISALGVNCASRDPERRLGLRALRAAAHSHSGG